MWRALQAESLAQIGTARPRCSSLSTVLRRHLSVKSEACFPERISKYSIEYVRQMAEKEKVSMTDHSQIEELIAAKEGEWEGEPERDEEGRPVFLLKMENYANLPTELIWDAIQSQFKYLNRRDVSADESYDYRMNALHICAKHEPLSPMMRWLLEDGNIDPNQREEFSESTPLHFAAVKDSTIECASLLLNDVRVDKDSMDQDGETPLMYAAYHNTPAMVSLLLQHGCNKDIRNNQGKTALMIADEERHNEVIQLLEL